MIRIHNNTIPVKIIESVVVINFQNKILLRGIIRALDDNGFLPIMNEYKPGTKMHSISSPSTPLIHYLYFIKKHNHVQA